MSVDFPWDILKDSWSIAANYFLLYLFIFNRNDDKVSIAEFNHLGLSSCSNLSFKAVIFVVQEAIKS